MQQEPVVLTPPPLYQLLFSAPLLLIVLVGLDLARAPSGEAVIMLLACGLLAVFTVPRAWAKVLLIGDEVSLCVPLRRPRSVQLRQLIGFENSGRWWGALLLRYHPMDERGRLDIANQEFLALVPLRDQYVLEQRLEVAVGSTNRPT